VIECCSAADGACDSPAPRRPASATYPKRDKWQIARSCRRKSSNVRTGKSSLSSLGGVISQVGFSTDSQAQTFADKIWDTFLGGSGQQRPFGDAALDGYEPFEPSFLPMLILPCILSPFFSCATEGRSRYSIVDAARLAVQVGMAANPAAREVLKGQDMPERYHFCSSPYSVLHHLPETAENALLLALLVPCSVPRPAWRDKNARFISFQIMFVSWSGVQSNDLYWYRTDQRIRTYGTVTPLPTWASSSCKSQNNGEMLTTGMLERRLSFYYDIV
jgi:hypothetical protein